MELGAEFKALLPVSGEEDIGRPVVSPEAKGSVHLLDFRISISKFPKKIHHLYSFFVFVSQALPEYCSLTLKILCPVFLTVHSSSGRSRVFYDRVFCPCLAVVAVP